MTRIEKAISNVAARDPEWLMKRMAEVQEKQRERDERVRQLESRLSEAGTRSRRNGGQGSQGV